MAGGLATNPHRPPVNWSITLRPRAKSDLRQAHDWYEECRAGLGDEFLAAHAGAMLRLETAPEGLHAAHKIIGHWNQLVFAFVLSEITHGIE
jgi:hypothetical protein